MHRTIVQHDTDWSELHTHRLTATPRTHTRSSAVAVGVAAPDRPSTLNVAGQDVGPKDAPLPSLFPEEPKPPAPVR